MQHLDGETTGPRGYTGVIGKQLERCEKKPVAKFPVIENDIPTISEEMKQQLSTDQQYLYEIVIAVSTGHVAERLEEEIQVKWPIRDG
jgi:hypothetical protein